MDALDYIILGIIIIGVLWAVRSIIKKGGCCGCSGNCESCKKEKK
ncbi:virus attachment protein p12 family protein [Anaerotignum neopropionicum]|uniref:Virus attachment protein p12 family protein n=1 Tax=Anaerotignum neopropionicum TaxID=36847 RepID=A0A136WB81_9FIRM|nr:FeoB-associated Cys-rich membrane protein [Anaerotignum neopropionicum]KXL51696.1 virus attachment protein p12 family protein [Anaerotignum neopropionicum]